MRILATLILIFLFYSCHSLKTSTDYNNGHSSYLVKKIKSKNDWHLIYAVKNDSMYKIVVKKEVIKNQECRKIIVGQYYDFVLHSRRENAPEINGIKIVPVNSLDIECFAYDNKTSICIEPKKGIDDLHFAENVRGLCIIQE